MLEFYWAYADYRDAMDLTEALMRELTQAVLGSNEVRYGENTFHFDQPFARMTVAEAILKYNPELTPDDLSDGASACAVATRLGLSVEDSWGLGKIQIEIFEETAEAKLQEPTFITAYPTEVSPLARRCLLYTSPSPRDS